MRFHLSSQDEGLNFSLVLPCKKIKLAKTGETANCHSSGCSGTLHFSLHLYENSLGLHTISEIKSLECNTCKKFDTYLFLETLKEHRAEKQIF